jgi:hypothetical protein
MSGYVCMSLTSLAKAFEDGYFEESLTFADRYDYYGDGSEGIFIERDVVFEERFNLIVGGIHTAILEPHPILDGVYKLRELDR